MQPIHELLDRIKWDADFGAAAFELGYYDRVEDEIIRIGLNLEETEPGEGGSFRIFDDEGVERSVPFHRIRRVWRDGDLIWSR